MPTAYREALQGVTMQRGLGWFGTLIILVILGGVVLYAGRYIQKQTSGETEKPRFSTSIADAKERGVYQGRVTVDPPSVTWMGERVRFEELWLEEAQTTGQTNVGQYTQYAERVCFTVDNEVPFADEKFQGQSRPSFDIGAGQRFVQERTDDVLVFCAPVPKTQDAFAADILNKWNADRHNAIKFKIAR